MRIFLATIGCCLMSMHALADTDYFARRFLLDLDGNAAYYTVTLPASVYEASQRGDLGDLRVFNGANEPVPYSLDSPPSVEPASAILQAVHWFPLAPAATHNEAAPLGVTIAADGSLRATNAGPGQRQRDTDLIDLGDAAGRVDALQVHLRDENYQGRISVEASDDLHTWIPAAEAQLLKATYDGNTLKQERIALDNLHARYVRLTWHDGPPVIASINIEVRPRDAPSTNVATRLQWREGIAARAGTVPGEYLFETGGTYPVDRLRLALPQENTVARAIVYSRTNAQSPWREVTRANLYRLHNGTSGQTNPIIEFDTDTDPEWRLSVDVRNGGLGSGALGVAAGWRAATVTFVARGTPPFTLSVGNAGLKSTAVSRLDLLPGGPSQEASARVGSMLPMPLHEASESSAVKDADSTRRYVLWVALLVAVGVLGGIAWKLARSAGGGEAQR